MGIRRPSGGSRNLTKTLPPVFATGSPISGATRSQQPFSGQTALTTPLIRVYLPAYSSGEAITALTGTASAGARRCSPPNLAAIGCVVGDLLADIDGACDVSVVCGADWHPIT